MTIAPTTPSTAPASAGNRLQRAGGVAGLVAAATFIYGIVMFATSLSDYTDPDATPAESVDFVVGHQGSLLAWYLGIFIVFGIALVPLALALRDRLAPAAPALARIGTVFAMIWAGLMFATGMVSNIGIEAVVDLVDDDPSQATAVWSAIDAVTNGLGGGNELVGALWILLVSAAAFGTRLLPRWLNVVGVLSAVAGLATLIPGAEAIEMVFGLGTIVWFAGVGTVLVRSRS